MMIREFLFGQDVGVKIRKGVRWGRKWVVVSSSNPGRGVTECWKEKKQRHQQSDNRSLTSITFNSSSFFSIF